MVDEVEFDIMESDDESRMEDDFEELLGNSRASARSKAGRKCALHCPQCGEPTEELHFSKRIGD